MDHYYYLKSRLGKLLTFLAAPSIFIMFVASAYEYSKGREARWYFLSLMLIGLVLFLKAKISVVRKGKYFSFGCDLMDQFNTNLYFVGWVLMIAGYFLSWRI